MSRFEGVLLLSCRDPRCQPTPPVGQALTEGNLRRPKEDRFAGETKAAAMRLARSCGWSFDGDKEICPEHTTPRPEV